MYLCKIVKSFRFENTVRYYTIISKFQIHVAGNEEWIWLWTTEGQEKFIGPSSVTVNATMGYPPVFYRANSKWKELFSSIAEKYSIY